MVTGFSVTFERWNESAFEAGDTDDRGYVIEDCSLSDAIRLGLEAQYPDWLNTPEINEYPVRSPRWLTFGKWNDGTHDYYTSGIEEQRSLHIPESVTCASRRRICRLFGVRT